MDSTFPHISRTRSCRLKIRTACRGTPQSCYVNEDPGRGGKRVKVPFARGSAAWVWVQHLQPGAGQLSNLSSDSQSSTLFTHHHWFGNDAGLNILQWIKQYSLDLWYGTHSMSSGTHTSLSKGISIWSRQAYWMCGTCVVGT